MSGGLYFREVTRSIEFVLSSIKSSLDREYMSASAGDPFVAESLMRFMLRIEELRLGFRPISRGSLRQRYDIDEIDSYMSRLKKDLSSLLEDRWFVELGSSCQFRMVAPIRDVRAMSEFFGEFEQKKFSVVDAARALMRLVSSPLMINPQNELPLIDDLPPTSEANVEGAARLRSLLPSQKLAPVQFKVENGRLVLAKLPNQVRPEDRRNVANSKDVLIESGNKIFAELRNSNCDKRLIEAFCSVQEQLLENNNIIKLALLNVTCSVMCNNFRSELSDAAYSMLQAYSRNVEMYAAQFPEWSRFVENAASVQLDENDVRRVRDAVKSIVQDLSSKSDVVDSEIPRTLARLNLLLESPLATSKRAAFSLLRSVENMVSEIYGYGANFFDQTARKTSEHLSSALAKIVVGTLLAMALSYASLLGPVAGKINEMSWLKTATEIVRSQIQQMGR